MKMEEKLMKRKIESFDEFLIDQHVQLFTLEESKIHLFKSNKNTIHEDIIVKALIRNSVYLLYRSKYLSLDNLEAIGLFDAKNKRLYPYYDIYNLTMSLSKYYRKSYSSVVDELEQDAMNLFNDYIKNKKEYLKKIAKPLFDKNLESKKFKDSLIKMAAIEYVFNGDCPMILKFNNLDDEKEDYSRHLKTCEINRLALLYLLDEVGKTDISNNLLKLYLEKTNYSNETYEETIGFRLLEIEYKNKILRDMYKKDDNEEFNIYRKTRNVVQAIKDIQAKFLTITLSCDNEEVTFKYPKGEILIPDTSYTKNENPLRRLSRYDISNKDRELVDKVLKKKSENYDIYINLITEIKWGKRILYREK